MSTSPPWPAGPGNSTAPPGPVRLPGRCAAGRGPASELVGGGDRLADGDLGRARVRAHRGDKRLQVGVPEELLELPDRLPLVDHQHEAVTDAEAVVNGAGRAGLIGERGQL